MQSKLRHPRDHRRFFSARILVGIAISLVCFQTAAKVQPRLLERVVHASETVATVRILEGAPLSDGQSKDGSGYFYRAALTEIFKGSDTREVRFRSVAGLSLGGRYVIFLPGRRELKERTDEISGPLWFEHVSPAERSCRQRYRSAPTLEPYSPQDIAEIDESAQVPVRAEKFEVKVRAAEIVALARVKTMEDVVERSGRICGTNYTLEVVRSYKGTGSTLYQLQN